MKKKINKYEFIIIMIIIFYIYYLKNPSRHEYDIYILYKTLLY
jgi:hypothetical protein